MEMDEYLAHYGIPGMRWGRRKNKSGSYSEDHKRVSALRTKKVSQMSNNELRDINNRMQLEQQYKQYRNAGKAKTTNTLKTIGKVTAKSLAIAGVLGGAKVIAKKFGLNESQASVVDKALKVVNILTK